MLRTAGVQQTSDHETKRATATKRSRNAERLGALTLLNRLAFIGGGTGSSLKSLSLTSRQLAKRLQRRHSGDGAEAKPSHRLAMAGLNMNQTRDRVTVIVITCDRESAVGSQGF